MQRASQGYVKEAKVGAHAIRMPTVGDRVLRYSITLEFGPGR